jgi:hypothetical protein
MVFPSSKHLPLFGVLKSLRRTLLEPVSRSSRTANLCSSSSNPRIFLDVWLAGLSFYNNTIFKWSIVPEGWTLVLTPSVAIRLTLQHPLVLSGSPIFKLLKNRIRTVNLFVHCLRYHQKSRKPQTSYPTEVHPFYRNLWRMKRLLYFMNYLLPDILDTTAH